jgi:carbamate kinase
VRREGRVQGIDAVIDKDLAAAQLAASVKAQALVLITGVDRVAINFRTPEERSIDVMTVHEARGYLQEGQFPPGSMGPKVSAAVRFLEAGGEVGIITTPQHAREALEGRHGTRIVPIVKPGDGAGS